MNVAFVFVIILVLLFALAFFSRRRFGMLGLALAAGSILSELWSSDLTLIIREAGLYIVSPPMESIVAAAVLLAPAIALTFSGPTYKKRVQRIIGSTVFSLLAFALLLPTLGNAIILAGDGLTVYTTISEYKTWIITVGLIFAFYDIVSYKAKKDISD